MNKILTFIGVVVLVTIGAFLFFNLGQEGDEITGKVAGEISFTGDESEVRNLIVVTSPWPPYAYSDDGGMPSGFLVEVLDSLFSRLDVSYEMRFVPWSRALEELEAGKSDATFAQYNDERGEFLYYTQEEQDYTEGSFPSTFLTESDQVFFARTLLKDSFNLESLDDILESDILVGAVAGYSSTKRLQDAGINVIEYPGEAEVFQALADREVDIVMEDKLPGFAHIKNLGLLDEVTVLPKSFWTDPMFMPFSKASDFPNLLEVRGRVLDELQKMRDSGEYDEIYRKYTE